MSAGTEPRGAGDVLEAAVAAGMVLVAAAGLQAVDASAGFLMSVAVVTLGSFASTTLFRSRLPAWAAPFLGGSVALALVVITSGVSVADLAGAVRTTVPTLLSTVLPVTDDPAVTAGLLALAGLCAVATATVLFGTSARLPVAVPPVLLFVVSVVLASGSPEVLVVNGMVLASLVGAFLMVRGGPARTDGPARARTVVLGVALVVLVGVTGSLLVGGALTPVDTERTEVRRDADADPSALLGPLAVYEDLRTQVRKNEVLYARNLSPRTERIRLAVTDAYDGTRWGTSDDYRPTGGRLPDEGPDAPARTTRATRSRITVTDFPGRFLPLPDGTVAVRDVEVDYSPATRAVITRDGQTADDRGYLVESSPTELDPTAIAAGTPAASTDPAAARALGAVQSPDKLRALYDRITSGADGAYPKLLAIQKYLADPANFVATDLADPPGPPAVAGLSAGVLAQAAGAPERPARLSSLQLVTLFALLADSGGNPVRVAVGFPVEPGATEQRLTGVDAHVWPEVLFDGIGWVPFEITDEVPPIPALARAQALVETAPETPAPGPSVTTDPKVTTPGARDEEPGTPLPWGWLLLALCTVLAIAAVPAAKTIRSRRRRHGSPDEVTEAAWRELVDRLADVDVDLRAAHTTEEACALVGALAPAAAEPMQQVGAALDAVVFGGTVPSPDDATATWERVDSVTDSIRSTRPPLRRLAAPFRPRGLLRRGRAR